MSKAEAAQRLLACAVEAWFGSGNSLAMVMGAKCLVKRVAERQRRWQRRNEARLSSANAEAKSKEAMYLTPPFALSELGKADEVRPETHREDDDGATNAAPPSVSLSVIRSAMVQGVDPLGSSSKEA